MPENLTWRRVPRVGYAYTLVAILLGTLLAAITILVWRWTLPPLQSHYVWIYFRIGIQAHAPAMPHHMNHSAAGYAYLRRTVFDGHTIVEVFRLPLIAAAACLAIALFFGMGFDAMRLNAFRKGKKLRGWDILTPRQFNRRTKGDGFALQIEK